MAYEPDLSAAPLSAVPPEPLPNPFGDLALASKNFWAGHTGQEYPPAPSYREVGGKLKLGRYMDPYGCEAHIRGVKTRWAEWYMGFLISAGIGVIFGTVDWVFIFVTLPIFAAWYFGVRSRYVKQYDLYYRIEERIIASGQPEWVAYDRDRLKLLDSNPLAVWP